MHGIRRRLRWGASQLSAGTLLLGAALVLPPAAAAQATAGADGSGDAPELTERERAAHLLARATYGVRPEDVDTVLQLGTDVWLERQLHPERIPDPVETVVAGRFPAVTLTPAALLQDYPLPRVIREQQRRLETDSLSLQERQALRRRLAQTSARNILFDLVGARLLRATRSERQLEQVMTDFWFDHFNVLWSKGSDRWLVGDFERTAIRPHVFGKFEDMLVATASHPAMLFYLDNWRSMSPDTAALRRTLAEAAPVGGQPAARGATARLLRRLPGLNENYARELLELHTLGVDGGYTQEDVINVARAFTGWSFTPPGPTRDDPLSVLMGRGAPQVPFAFWFRPLLHDQAPKTLLGEEIPAGGREEGLEVLRRLARHPSTAHHVAERLAIRFVADEPPEELVERLARVFLETGGDLREVTHALFTAPELYDPAHVRGRVKSPFLLVASALRVTGAGVTDTRNLLERLRLLGEAPYHAEPPTGFPEESVGWAASGAMLERWRFALELTAGAVPGVETPGSVLANPSDADQARDMVSSLLGGHAPEPLVLEVQAMLDAPEGTRADRWARALGLVLGSPDFQRH